LSLITVFSLGACTKEQAPARPAMTQRQRDSAIGESKIPGAQGVRGALRVQDSAQARNSRLDSIN
jgi:hypothetical protein